MTAELVPDGRWPVNGCLPPLRFTTVCWFNRWKNGGYSKVLAAYGIGVYKTFAYGTHTPPSALWLRHHRAERRILQTGIVCTAPSGVIMTDVDFLAEYRGTRTAKLIGREHAFTARRDDRFHIAIDARAVPLADWPRKRPIAGADIISNGFVPWPGSEHYSGEIYKPTYMPWYVVWPWPGLIEAIHADQADERPRRQGGGGGHGCGGGSGEPVDIAGLTKTGLPTGGRNNTLLSAACSLFRRYGTAPDGEASVRAELGPVLQRTDTSGFDGDEIDTVIERARQFIVGRELWELEAWKALRAVAR